MQTFRLVFATLVAFGLAACSQQGIVPPAGQSVASNSVTRPLGGKGYKLLYSFPGGAGGTEPTNGVTFVNGTAFGTAYSGGDVSGCNCGIIFAAGKVIYTFKGGTSKDGSGPTGDLLLVGKKLYGTTDTGGLTGGICAGTQYRRPGCGTVFEVDTSGNERIVYRFKGGKDGASPVAGLVYGKGVLYGATVGGGEIPCTSTTPLGCGTIFAIDLSGHEKVIYRFKGGADGAYPATGLLAMKSTMYGVTSFGGGACLYGPGCGTVFRITRSGHESVIYAFKGGSDGIQPAARLIAVNGFLYGTTFFGGCLHDCPSIGGSGIIFKLSVTGGETILHRFLNRNGKKGRPGAMDPLGDLVFLNNQLYGTTNSGGCLTCAGTIYSANLRGAVKILYLFNAVSGGAKQPEGLTLEPSTQALFGNAQFGGSAGKGAIFRYVL